MREFLRKVTTAARSRRDMDGMLRQVSAAPIVAAGVDDDGDPWIRLKDGLELFGLKPRDRFARAYGRLPASVRSLLPRKCIQVAVDYVVRFEGGALMRGGPIKQKHYRVRSGDTVVEMGGYLGHYALRLAREVGPEGRVVAIEPNPGNLRLLRKNLAANGAQQVTVVDRGVWREPDTMTFTVDGDDGQSGSLHLTGGERVGTDVQVDSLDNILGAAGVEQVDFMVIQLNGVEVQALEGLTRVRPRHLAIAARYALADGREAAEVIAATLDARNYWTEIDGGAFVFGRALD